MNDFSLIETMRFEPEAGILRLRLHLARLKRSASRLGFLLPVSIETALETAIAAKSTGQPLRVRLELFRNGRMEIAAVPFVPGAPGVVWTVRIARTRLSSSDPLLRYKTSRRAVYDSARAEYGPDEAQEVMLLNERSEPCEGTITSLFLDDGSGILKTPPIACGLLAGVLRTELICQRKARVERLTLDALREGPFYVGNSLRGLIPARLA